MKKCKLKRFLCILACFIVLFTFLTVPAFAYNSINSDSSPSDFVSSPVPLEFYISGQGKYKGYTSQNPVTDFTFVKSFSDTFQVNSSEIDHFHFNYDESSEDLPDDCSFFLNMNNDHMFSSLDYGFDSNLTYFGFCSSQLYDFGFHIQDHDINYSDFSLSLRDFFVWNNYFDLDFDVPEGDYNFDLSPYSEISLIFYSDAYVGLNYTLMPKQVLYSYSYFGDSTVYTQSFDISIDDFTDGNAFFLNFSPDQLGLDSADSYLLYFYDCRIIYDVSRYSDVWFTFSDDFPNIELTANYAFNPYLSNFDGKDYLNPSLNLAPYTTWLGSAASGFLDFEIFQGFTIGGIFMTLVAFSCVMWFLKLVAGG